MALSSIGIIANPASGKDIRRLVSYATVIDNNEKINIVKRIVLAAQATGIQTIYCMPDTFCIGYAVQDSLAREGVLRAELEVLDMKLTASAEDSTRAARRMEALGVGCIVVLGGDGTSRAVAKGVADTPILPLSTGTNNVYPQMLEGTVAGMAASAVARMEEGRSCCIRDKQIGVSVNGKPVDIALIDAVFSSDLYAGAKAIWDYDGLKAMAVTRCHPATIGFSAIAGCLRIIRDSDDMGMLLHFGPEGKRVRAAVAAGMLHEISIRSENALRMDDRVELPLEHPGMVALDGEREVKVKRGDTLSFQISRNGPWRVLPLLAVEQAMAQGMYNME